jgi:hypothetical protein
MTSVATQEDLDGYGADAPLVPGPLDLSDAGSSLFR